VLYLINRAGIARQRRSAGYSSVLDLL
jgi:hypothetical protein